MKKKPLTEEEVRALKLRKEFAQAHKEFPFGVYISLFLLFCLIASIVFPLLAR